MTVQIHKATKKQAKLRLAIDGPSGAGKTYTSLRISKGLGGTILVVDTEAGSAEKYADQFDFDAVTLTSFHPQNFIDAINAAGEGGYGVVILDSLSHAWQGKDGVLEQVERRKANERNQFAAWREPSALHQNLINAILQAKCHVIFTMRSKMEYTQDGGNVKRVGLAPVQREGMEYEADIVLDMDRDHNGRVSKSRIAALADAVIVKPGEELGRQLAAWLSEGAPMPEPKKADPKPSVPRYEAPPIAEVSTQDDIDRAWHAVNADTSPASKFALTKAKAWLKESGFASWADFKARRTTEQSEDLLILLVAPALIQ